MDIRLRTVVLLLSNEKQIRQYSPMSLRFWRLNLRKRKGLQPCPEEDGVIAGDRPCVRHQPPCFPLIHAVFHPLGHVIGVGFDSSHLWPEVKKKDSIQQSLSYRNHWYLDTIIYTEIQTIRRFLQLMNELRALNSFGEIGTRRNHFHFKFFANIIPLYKPEFLIRRNMAKYTGTLSDLCITYTALTRILLL